MVRWLLVLAGMLAAGDLRAEASFTLVNHTGRTIVAIYSSPSRAGDWGRRLNAQPLADRAEQRLKPSTQDCRQDVLVEFGPGEEQQRFKVDLCAGPRLVWGEAAPAGDDPSFEFINGTGLPVTELYVAHTGQLATTFDLLAIGAIPAGGRLWVPMPPGWGCLLDVAFVMADQTRREFSLVETCSVRDITFR
jgi:hypothetical protein